MALVTLAGCSARDAFPGGPPPPPALSLVTAAPTLDAAAAVGDAVPPASPAALAQASATPAAPTAAPPDPTRTPWPGAINRFEREVELIDPVDGLAWRGPLIGFHLVRDRVTFRVHYSPGAPRFISQWAVELSRSGPPPLLIIPGGFFSQDNFAQGLLVSDGVLYSQARDIGGVFVVQGGEPDIRWLESEPIRPGEEFEQAVQAFPVFVSRGYVVTLNEHVRRDPRTILVETTSGDFVVLLSLTGLFRTTDLPQWLADSGLEVYSALNLDGGRSAGYWAGDGDTVDSGVPLPAVIAVYAR